MKILVVCQHYWPEDFQITAVCEDLVSRGHELTVVTGLPNYPSGIIPPDYRNGHNRRQEKDGVRILRAYEIGRRKGPIGLAINYYSFVFSAKALTKKLANDYDAVFSYQLSPVMMAEPAVCFKQRTGTPLLLYCCDLWPESMKVILGNKLKPLFNYYTKISTRVYEQADVLAVQSTAFIDYFKQIHGLPESRLIYVPHFASEIDLTCIKNESMREGINFLFMGNMGRAQNLPCIVEAIATMKHKVGFTVHFVGDGACLANTKQLVDKLNLENRVVFHGRKPFSEMPKYYQMADACLLTLDGSSWVGTTLPSKLQGYMAAKKPVLAAINGGARRVIEDSGCGFVVEAGDSEGLGHLMDEFIESHFLYKKCGEKGRAYFEKNFLKSQHVDAIEKILFDLHERGRCG